MSPRITCGVDSHPDTCLCDVRITSPTSIRTDVSHPYVEMTQLALGKHASQSQVQFWATMLDIWDRTRALGIGPALPWADLLDLAASWTVAQREIDRGQDHPVNHARQRSILTRLRTGGFSNEAAAVFLGTDLKTVERLLAHEERKLLALEMLRQGAKPVAVEVATGLSRATVYRIASEHGLVIEPKTRKPKLGGHKHPPEVYTAVLQAFAEGKSRNEIAKEMSLPYHTINGILRRRSAQYAGKSRQVSARNVVSAA